MPGLGGQEILLLGLCCGVMPAGVAFLTYILVRRQSSRRVDALEAENRELRKRSGGGEGPPRKPWDPPV